MTSRLDFNDQVHVVGPFSIHHVTNSGIAFGLFASATSLVILLTALAVAWMLYFFARSGSRHPVLPVALGLVIGGSVSNLLDRVRLGHVTDFLDFRYWPAFNLADTFIVVGVAALAARARGRPTASRAGPSACVKLRVPDEAAGERLDRFLASLPEVGSRGVAERLLEARAVLVDGKSLAKSRRLVGGEELEFDPPEPGRPSSFRSRWICASPYEDEDLVVVDKPAGLVVHPAPGMRPGTLVHGLLEHDVAGGDADRPGIVHRLDRDTSGLMVVARSEEAHAGCRSSCAAMSWIVITSRSSSADRGRAAAGSKRRSAATGATPCGIRSTPTRPAMRSPTSMCVSSCRATRCSTCGSRRGGPTRSVSTSPRSTCRWPEIPSTAGPASSSSIASSSMPGRLAFPHPFTGRAGWSGVAAPRRPGQPARWSAPRRRN